MSVLTEGTFVLVADGEKALFLRNKGDAEFPSLEVVREEERDNPKDSEQSANKPGRAQDSGRQQTSAMDDTDWHELAKERFADDLADILFKQAHKHKFDRLVIAAAPKVLGELRNKMHKEVKSRVVAEVAKDLTNHPPHEMEKVLSENVE
ncbi:Host attachment protein [Roseivivax halodurans JCM 10272]|uniref:Host attachment protein n=1 Tax=Roseivivax halodurans JCM 10272 TaxID=1449350 RepID=X7EER3_9RHOB|nr:host attachment family protein [Roseivivax halodurans]ETX14350.1 Host attachment protein [Roseivivax halodurans JCM 10272]